MSAIPPMRSSSSRSSKTLTRSGGMSSLKPVTKASNWAATRFWMRHSVRSLFWGGRGQVNDGFWYGGRGRGIQKGLMGIFGIKSLQADIELGSGAAKGWC